MSKPSLVLLNMPMPDNRLTADMVYDTVSYMQAASAMPNLIITSEAARQHFTAFGQQREQQEQPHGFTIRKP